MARVMKKLNLKNNKGTTRAFWKRFGPGMLVTAAFVGPGTVTTASKAGADFGMALVWALGIAVIAAIVLQEMAARLGLVTRRGLGEALCDAFPSSVGRRLSVGLVLTAILLGNVAYQAGNLTGAALGMETLMGGSVWMWVLVSGLVALGLLLLGAYRTAQSVLIGLVLVMSVVFVGSAVASAPLLGALVSGMGSPRLPTGSLATVVGLIGTTVVPYNLFLHARSVQEKWPPERELSAALTEARWDTVVAILLGGLITFAILLTAATSFYLRGVPFENLGQGARQLEPLLGKAAQGMFALGIFAAGLTSTITAPLAAATRDSSDLAGSATTCCTQLVCRNSPSPTAERTSPAGMR